MPGGHSNSKRGFSAKNLGVDLYVAIYDTYYIFQIIVYKLPLPYIVSLPALVTNIYETK